MPEPPSADANYPQPARPGPSPNQRRSSASVPHALTSFIGRQREVEQLAAMLRRDDVRLVTLTGPGGVGKTRLALRVGDALADCFVDGVAFVSLDAVRDPALVAPTIATVLGIRDVGERPSAVRLASALHDQHLLLLLDNFEQVVEAAPLVIDLLQTAPSLTVLVTSRVRLSVSGERQHAVPPLELAQTSDASVTTVAESAAVQLFVERAQAVQGDFQLTTENTPTVAEICRRLDGLPLAIELAAARVAVLPPHTLLDRLEHRLPLLTGGPRDHPVRMQTMRGAIAWSYDLLSDEERTLFRRLAVFAGGCTLEAAETLATDGGDVLEGVAALVAASLLQRRQEVVGVPHYVMLETIREYAQEQLAASGEELVIQRARAYYFLGLTEQLWASFEQTEWTKRERRIQLVQADLDNFRAVLAWLVTHEPTEALRLAGALDIIWNRSNRFAEGRLWLTRALTATSDASLYLRTRALVAAGWLAHELGDFKQAEIELTEALAQARALGDDRLLTDALSHLSTVKLSLGEPEAARPLVDEQRTYATATGDPLMIAIATLDAGVVAYQMGDLPRAGELLTEALDLHQRYNGPYAAAHAQGWLANVILAQGEIGRGAKLVRDSIAGFATAGNWAVVAENLEGLAHATVASHPVPTVHLLGAAAAMRERFDHPRKSSDALSYDNMLATARATLGDPSFSEDWNAGRQLSQDEVLTEVDALVAATTDAHAGQPTDTAKHHGLTPRELEVLRLVAAGHSNREIADALFVSQSTAITHVRHILGKLGLDSRTATAAWAIRHDLA